jgi:hypothetical protein
MQRGAIHAFEELSIKFLRGLRQLRVHTAVLVRMLSRGRRHFAPGWAVRDIATTALAHKKDQVWPHTNTDVSRMASSM